MNSLSNEDIFKLIVVFLLLVIVFKLFAHSLNERFKGGTKPTVAQHAAAQKNADQRAARNRYNRL
jgi:hypothetical protein